MKIYMRENLVSSIYAYKIEIYSFSGRRKSSLTFPSGKIINQLYWSEIFVLFSTTVQEFNGLTTDRYLLLINSYI